MTDLIAELAEVVRSLSLATPGIWRAHRATKYTHLKSVNGDYVMEYGQRGLTHRPHDAQGIAIAVNFLRTHHAEIEEMVRDASYWRELKRDAFEGRAELLSKLTRLDTTAWDAAMHDSAREDGK